jgi:predicted RNase H-like HicB family nuclease
LVSLGTGTVVLFHSSFLIFSEVFIASTNGVLHSGKGKSKVNITLTAVFKKVPEGYVGYVEELPGANTQGKTLDETRENLKEAIELVLEANRQLAEESLDGTDVIREPLALMA